MSSSVNRPTRTGTPPDGWHTSWHHVRCVNCSATAIEFGDTTDTLPCGYCDGITERTDMASNLNTDIGWAFRDVIGTTPGLTDNAFTALQLVALRVARILGDHDPDFAPAEFFARVGLADDGLSWVR